MSWDIFVQDLPAEARSVAEIPDDFRPKPIGRRADVIAKILEVCPAADFSDAKWGVIETGEGSIEVNLGGEEDPLTGIAFHIRGGGVVVGLIADLLERLGSRALDPGSDTGFFDPASSAGSLARWRAYRDTILRRPPAAR